MGAGQWIKTPELLKTNKQTETLLIKAMIIFRNAEIQVGIMRLK